MSEFANAITKSRRQLMALTPDFKRAEDAAEGGCGVFGLAANIPIAGRHVLTASTQMHNRGNGKGGGIAMVGLDPRQAGVDMDTLRSHYLLQIALLDPTARAEVEAEFITPNFDIAQADELPHLDDYRQVEDLRSVRRMYGAILCAPRPASWRAFAEKNGLASLALRALEDEFVYQNSYRLNIRSTPASAKSAPLF